MKTKNAEVADDGLELLSEVNPEEEIINWEEHDRLMGFIEELPDRYRDLILLRYDLGYSTKEIAELTDTTRAAVQKTLFRARRALEKEMEAL